MKFNLINKNPDSDSYITQYLANRGVTESVDEFFNLSWEDVQEPTALDYMEEGAEMLIRHIEADSTIAVILDCDMDGFTSSALFFNMLYFYMQPDRPWDNFTGQLIPMYHEAKIHGLDDVKIMRDIRDKVKPDLVVIPDASGTEEQYAALVALGIDILVLDHHDTSCRGDGENVIVINNQHSENYKNKELSGVGVVWQFCQYIDNGLGWDASIQWLDLVACGLVGDMMNLKSRETRFLVTKGLQNIHSYFLQYFAFTNYSMKDKEYNPHNISFYVTPMFNAVCRFGSLEEKEMLFKSLVDTYAEDEIENGTRGHKGEFVPLAQEAIRLAANTKGRQDRRKNKLVEKIHTIVQEEDYIDHKVLVFGFDDFEEEYRALSGLAANVLAEYYQRPVIITFKKGSDYVGSLRVPDTDNPIYQNFKDQCNDSGYCTFAAGHQEAAGIGIRGGCVNKLMEHFDEKYKEASSEIYFNVDFVMDANDERIKDLVGQMYSIRDIHGQGLKEPKIAITNVKVAPSTLRLVGQKASTLWITAPHCKFINFRSSKEEYDSLRNHAGSTSETELFYSATIIGKEPDMNEWAGEITPQLKIADYEIGNPRYEF